MVVVTMEDSLCEWLWALFEGETYCRKIGTGVLGNQIQPPRDGMRLVLTICCEGSMFTRAYAYETPVLQKRHSTGNWSSLEGVVQNATGPMGIRFCTRKCSPKIAKITMFFKTEKTVPVHRVSFWRGVLRDDLLRRCWVRKFLGKKRKRQLLRSLFSDPLPEGHPVDRDNFFCLIFAASAWRSGL